MLVEPINFNNSLNLELHSMLYLPDRSSARPAELIPLVIFAHGLNSSRASSTIQALSARLLARDIAALLFDFTGHGESGGTIADATITQQVDDLQCALALARADTRFKPIGLYGEITGGTVALRVAAADNAIKALVLQGPREDSEVTFKDQITVPTLIIQGSADLVVRAESRNIYDSLAGKKQFHIVAGAGHQVDEQPGYQAEAVDVAVDWFSEHLVRARTVGR